MKNIFRFGVAVVSSFFMASCSIEGNDPIQKQRQQKLVQFINEQMGTPQTQLIGLPISASFCKAKKPIVEQKDCLNFAVQATSAGEAEEKVNQIKSAIARICTFPDKCAQLGQGVIVLSGVWLDPRYSGSVTPYALSTGDVHQGSESVFFLGSGKWK